jgi:hypothetical protein
MADEPVKASAENLATVSQHCHEFSDEVTGMLNHFSDEITTLLSGALQSPRIKEKLLEVQDQINDCKKSLHGTMQYIGDAFKANADQYAHANDTSHALVAQLTQDPGTAGASTGGSQYDYTSLASA